MELRILSILAFLTIGVVVNNAAIAPENYWKQELPNAVMPKSVRNSLPDNPDELMNNKGTSVGVGKGGVNVNTKGAKGGTTVNVGPHKGVDVNTNKPGGGHTSVNVGPKSGVGVTTGKPGGGHTDVHVGPKTGVSVSAGKPNKGGADVGVGKGGVIVHAGPKKKPVYVGVHPGYNPFNYVYSASETQLHDDPTKALFFLEKDMKVGHQMKMQFTQSTNGATFLSREEAQSIPFSTDKMSDIYHEFSVHPGSVEAQIMEETIKGCEHKGIEGEEKYCATSLESMVDYAKSTLGKNVKAASTEAKGIDNKLQTYKIYAVKKLAEDDNAAVCHKQNYAYAVFYCHKSKATSAYSVALFGEDGSKTKAVVICHKDTSVWNPKHLAFQVLNVKPGTVPICHFLPEDHVVWVRN